MFSIALTGMVTLSSLPCVMSMHVVVEENQEVEENQPDFIISKGDKVRCIKYKLGPSFLSFWTPSEWALGTVIDGPNNRGEVNVSWITHDNKSEWIRQDKIEPLGTSCLLGCGKKYEGIPLDNVERHENYCDLNPYVMRKCNYCGLKKRGICHATEEGPFRLWYTHESSPFKLYGCKSCIKKCAGVDCMRYKTKEQLYGPENNLCRHCTLWRKCERDGCENQFELKDGNRSSPDKSGLCDQCSKGISKGWHTCTICKKYQPPLAFERRTFFRRKIIMSDKCWYCRNPKDAAKIRKGRKSKKSWMS